MSECSRPSPTRVVETKLSRMVGRLLRVFLLVDDHV
jgi:hypothetical protein